MKKVTLILMALAIASGLLGQVILFESFDGDTFPPPGWSKAQGSGATIQSRGWIPLTEMPNISSSTLGRGDSPNAAVSESYMNHIDMPAAGNNLTANNYLFTPAIQTVPGQTYELNFFARVLDRDFRNETLTVHRTESISGSTPAISDFPSTELDRFSNPSNNSWSQRSVTFTANSTTTYIAFRHTGTNQLGVVIDDVMVRNTTSITNDLLIQSISGESKIRRGRQYTYSVIARNAGTANATSGSYSLQLWRRTVNGTAPDSVLIATASNAAINAGATRTWSVNYTPSTSEEILHEIFATIHYTNGTVDQYPANNSRSYYLEAVKWIRSRGQSSTTPHHITGNMRLFPFQHGNGLLFSVYRAANLTGLQNGDVITSLTFEYFRGVGTSPPADNVAIDIYMGNTTSTGFTGTNGSSQEWFAFNSNSFTRVWNGSSAGSAAALNFSDTTNTGIHEVTINFPSNYRHTYNGTNIIMVSRRLWSPNNTPYTSTPIIFIGHGTASGVVGGTHASGNNATTSGQSNYGGNNNSSLSWTSNGVFAGTQATAGTMWGYLPRMKFGVQSLPDPIEYATLSGTVTLTGGSSPAAGVELQIAGTSMTTTTNANGFYSFSNFPRNHNARIIARRTGIVSKVVTPGNFSGNSNTFNFDVQLDQLFPITADIINVYDNSPIEGAVVTINGVSYPATGSDGKFTTGDEMTPGNYTASITAPGYAPLTTTITHSTGEIKLYPLRTFQVLVKDAYEPSILVDNATVSISATDGSFSDSTNESENGLYSFENAPTGKSYNITVTHNDYDIRTSASPTLHTNTSGPTEINPFPHRDFSLTVTDAISLQPLDGAYVSLNGGTGYIYGTSESVAGVYTLTRVATGGRLYQATVNIEGYETGIIDVTCPPYSASIALYPETQIFVKLFDTDRPQIPVTNAVVALYRNGTRQETLVESNITSGLYETDEYGVYRTGLNFEIRITEAHGYVVPVNQTFEHRGITPIEIGLQEDYISTGMVWVNYELTPDDLQSGDSGVFFDPKSPVVNWIPAGSPFINLTRGGETTPTIAYAPTSRTIAAQKFTPEYLQSRDVNGTPIYHIDFRASHFTERADYRIKIFETTSNNYPDLNNPTYIQSVKVANLNNSGWTTVYLYQPFVIDASKYLWICVETSRGAIEYATTGGQPDTNWAYDDDNHWTDLGSDVGGSWAIRARAYKNPLSSGRPLTGYDLYRERITGSTESIKLNSAPIYATTFTDDLFNDYAENHPPDTEYRYRVVSQYNGAPINDVYNVSAPFTRDPTITIRVKVHANGGDASGNIIVTNNATSASVTYNITEQFATSGGVSGMIELPGVRLDHSYNVIVEAAGFMMTEVYSTDTITGEIQDFTDVNIHRISSIVFSEDFEGSFRNGWLNIDANDDGRKWQLFDRNDPGDKAEHATALAPYRGNWVAYSESWCSDDNTCINPDNWLISPPISIPYYAEQVVLNFFAAAASNVKDAPGHSAISNDTPEPERYSVYIVSPQQYAQLKDETDIYVINDILSEIESERIETKTLNNWAYQPHFSQNFAWVDGFGDENITVHFAIRHHDSQNNHALKLDNINVSIITSQSLAAITGRITNAQGVGLPAEILINDNPFADANSNGYFSFEHPIDTEIKITYRHPGFITSTPQFITPDGDVDLGTTVLQRAITVSGTVFSSDPEGGLVHGATVTVVGSDPLITTTSNNETALYSLSVAAGNRTLAFSHPDYEDATLNIVVGETNMTDQDITLRTLYAITGTVVGDDDTTTGLAGVEVTLHLDTEDITTTTSDTGVFSFAGYVEGTYLLSFSTTGYAYKEQTIEIPEDIDETFVLNKFYTITGTVYADNPADTPLENATVYLLNLNGDNVYDTNLEMISDITNTDGLFTLTGLICDDYRIFIEHQYYFSPESPNDEFTVTPDALTHDFIMTKGLIIRGIVKGSDTADDGIVGASVVLTGEDDQTIGSETVSMADGIFEFSKLIAGTYTLTVNAPAYDEQTPADFTERYVDEDILDYTITLQRHTVVRGKVIGSHRLHLPNEDQGIGGIIVTLLDAETDDPIDGRATTTADDGYYVIGPLVAGDYKLRFSDRNEDYIVEIGEPFTVTGPDITHPTITLSRLFTISGTVSDDAENVISGVEVELFEADDTLLASTTTDSGGRYIFNRIVAGDYYIKFTLNAHFSDTLDATVQYLDLPDTDLIINRNTISGRVTDMYMAGFNNVSVYIYDEEENYDADLIIATTGPDGTYSVKLLPDVHKLVFEYSGTFSQPVIADNSAGNVENIDYQFTGLVLDDDQLIVVKTGLRGNYPNPFNPETNIQFAVEAQNAASVLIEIYNIRGQKVRTLVNAEFSAGIHNAIWNGNDDNGQPVGSGVYFYRMRTGNFVETKRMLLLK